ncbi:MAG: hypothetical protein AB1578_11000 [Thermodesulfobacteriota bacterium]
MGRSAAGSTVERARRRCALLGSLLVWPAVAALWLGACGAPPERGALPVGPGTRLEDLPAGYGLVLGRISVWVDGDPLPCPAAPEAGECRLVFRYGGAQTLSLPLRSAASLGARREPEPFYVIRLPQGDYELTRFEGGGTAVPPRFRGEVPLGRRFELRPGEALYVGSLRLDLPAGRGRPAVHVADESDLARDAADDLQPGLGARLQIRLAQ